MKLIKMLVLSVFSISIIVLSARFTGYAEDAASGNEFQYLVSEEGAVITGYTATSSDAVIYIPDTIGGHKVTAIGDRAFEGNNGAETVRLPDTLAKIGEGAFRNCPKLGNVLLPNGVKYIGREAFKGAGKMLEVFIPKETKIIGSAAFWSESLLEINVAPDNEVFMSEKGILYDKRGTTLLQFPPGYKMKSYTILSRVKFIGDKAFAAPTIEKIYITNKTIVIGEGNFTEKFPSTIGKGLPTIYCYRNSTAERYAKEHNLPISYISTTQSNGGSGSSNNNASSSSSGVWRQDGKGWWLHKSDGSYPTAQWMQIKGNWYWFNSEGYMATGWQKVNQTWYFLNPDGAMVSNNWTLQKGNWYFLNADGSMKTGWVEWKGNWYFLNQANGHMEVNMRTPDGFIVDGSGVWRK